MRVENVTPYSSDEAKGVQVERMFDRIAPTYDALNHGMSWSVDRYWRRQALAMLDGYATGGEMLDIATGTGDFAICAAELLKPRSIAGVDISEGMLAIGRSKVEKRGLADIISFRRGDVLCLPFADETFDVATVAFGVRNFQDLHRGLSEICRVLKSGGRVVIVELSSPKNAIVRRLFNIYSHTVLPLAGRLLPHDVQAYRYLVSSMEAFPQAEAMSDVLHAAGFMDVSFHRMTIGICTRYLAIKR